MQTFHTRVAALDETLFEGEVEHCRVRTEAGSIGLEARHEAFLAALMSDSKIELRTQIGENQEFPVSEGLLSFKDNRCTILLGSK